MSRLPEFLFFVASAGNLFLANLVVFRARRARGAFPIALLCLSLFVWDFGEGEFLRTQNDRWYVLRLVGSSLAPSFLWHFVLVFTGRDRSLRPWLYGVYALSGAFALATVAALWRPSPFADFVFGDAWNIVYLSVFMPLLAACLVLVEIRRRGVQTPVERNAANFVLLGTGVAIVMGFTQLVHRFWISVPGLGHIGSVVCALALAVAILRHRLLEKQAPVRLLFACLMLGGSALVVIVLGSWLLKEEMRTLFLVAAVGLTAYLTLHRTVFAQLREQAQRRERLALIGTMAAGVAHEIRNPLASIKGAAQFVQKDLEGTPGRDEAKEYLQLLVGEVDRLNGVVESFLAYARPIDPRRQDVLLDVFLKDLLRLHAAALPPSVKVETAFETDLGPVKADPALLTQAVTNAVRNAAEAMGEGGTLTIRTSGVASALRNWAAIEVEDTGPGIPRQDLDRIFQPFFTTKAKGTGLGLAISLRILEAHGGDLVVENVKPHGCRFTFYLPLSVL
jgi:signal transduction histidine kinase